MFSKKVLGKKIQKLRLDYSFSQKELAQKIGISRVALSQLEIGKRGLDALELVKLAQIFNIEPSSLLKDEEPVKGKTKKQVDVKKFKFDKNKLKNVILYILEKCGGKPNVGETVLYKLLYFIDFDSYEVNGSPVTGMNYVKLQFGPVPRAKDYNPVVDLMIKNNELKLITQEHHGMVQKRYIALKESDKNNLTDKDKNIINEVILKYSDMSARSIENFAHGDVPWKQAENQDIIDYNLVFNRMPPYAHNDYDAEFVQAGSTKINEDLKPLTREEYDYYEKL
ncbi:MAG: type II toxin-antitoxin system antitoxin SocA domain-containing protein [Patescibacteria group bacterium]